MSKIKRAASKVKNLALGKGKVDKSDKLKKKNKKIHQHPTAYADVVSDVFITTTQQPDCGMLLFF